MRLLINNTLNVAAHACSPVSPVIAFAATPRRDRTTVGSFQEGKASVYALVAKDQLLSFRDLGCAACSTRENAEVVASVRSQREAAEARAAVGARTNSEVVTRTVAAAPTLTDARMDEHWRAVSVVKKQEVMGGGGSCWCLCEEIARGGVL